MGIISFVVVVPAKVDMAMWSPMAMGMVMGIMGDTDTRGLMAGVLAVARSIMAMRI
jgi:hypothetical protein